MERKPDHPFFSQLITSHDGAPVGHLEPNERFWVEGVQDCDFLSQMEDVVKWNGEEWEPIKGVAFYPEHTYKYRLKEPQ